MKQSEILKVLEAELGTSKLEEVNKALKAKNFSTKFRITGPAFIHYGFTGLIKALTQEGVKVYNVNKVNLVSYADIDTFAKAVPRDERKKSPKPGMKQAKPAKKIDFDDEEDYENDDDFDELADEPDDIVEDDTVRTRFEKQDKEEFRDTKKKKKKNLHIAGSGSLFIPKKK